MVYALTFPTTIPTYSLPFAVKTSTIPGITHYYRNLRSVYLYIPFLLLFIFALDMSRETAIRCQSLHIELTFIDIHIPGIDPGVHSIL
ncbi:hypothetical protein BDR04DRAFT_777435 [Suillus decipiens]|nr:hypothetical protein BDR04DRAFT_777435 [Suillus decipiens]